jgi:hypothetical protein
MDNHPHAYCYVDPASKAFKPEVRARRIEAAKAKGVALPDYLQDEKGGALAAVQPGDLVQDLIGALRLVGGLQEE